MCDVSRAEQSRALDRDREGSPISMIFATEELVDEASFSPDFRMDFVRCGTLEIVPFIATTVVVVVAHPVLRRAEFTG